MRGNTFMNPSKFPQKTPFRSLDPKSRYKPTRTPPWLINPQSLYCPNHFKNSSEYEHDALVSKGYSQNYPVVIRRNCKNQSQSSIDIYVWLHKAVSIVTVRQEEKIPKDEYSHKAQNVRDSKPSGKYKYVGCILESGWRVELFRLQHFPCLKPEVRFQSENGLILVNAQYSKDQYE
jgi:hypothetical protein